MPKRPLAIVTGGSGQVGQKVSFKLAQQGFDVLIPYRSAQPWEQWMDAMPGSVQEAIVGYQLDLLQAEQVAQFVQQVLGQYGKVDALVHCAGGFVGGKGMEETTFAEWEQMWQQNLMTAVHITRPVFAAMKKQQSGSIIFIAAQAAEEAPASLAAYSVSKRALLQLAETLVKEGVRENIRVNTLLPGTIATPSNLEWMSEEQKQMAVTPDEIAEVICFLLSPGGKALHGSSLRFIR